MGPTRGLCIRANGSIELAYADAGGEPPDRSLTRFQPAYVTEMSDALDAVFEGYKESEISGLRD
jgi:hypothetical protein